MVADVARTVLGWSPIRRFRQRFAPQIAWLARRLSVNQAYGLGVTAGLLLTAALTWALAVLTESVLTRDPLTLLDRTVAEFLHDRAVPGLTDVMEVVTYMGAGSVLIPLAIVLAGLLLWRRRSGEALLIVTATAGASALNFLVKNLMARPRPDIIVSFIDAEGFSFPSGHATVSTAFYLTLGLLAAGWVRKWESRVYVLLAALAAILLVGFSRLYLGVHYLSDVLAGFTLGGLWVTIAVTTAALWQQGHHQRAAKEAQEPPEGEEAAAPAGEGRQVSGD
jgi:undecaprenyl-diphosphatase